MLHGSGLYRDLVVGMGLADRSFAVRNRHSSHRISGAFIAVSRRRCGNAVQFRIILLEGNFCDANAIIGHCEGKRVATDLRRNGLIVLALGQRDRINDLVLIIAGWLDTHGDCLSRSNLIGKTVLRQVCISTKAFACS